MANVHTRWFCFGHAGAQDSAKHEGGGVIQVRKGVNNVFFWSLRIAQAD